MSTLTLQEGKAAAETGGPIVTGLGRNSTAASVATYRTWQGGQ